MALFEDDINGKKGKLSQLKSKLQKDYDLSNSDAHNMISSAIANSNGLQQTVINITGYSKSNNALKAHASYLTSQNNRDNTLKKDTFKTIAGNPISKDKINKKLKEWVELDGGKKNNSRIALKMVLSSPKDSDPRSVERAVSMFAEKEFGKTNDYFHVLHTDTNNPHIHLVVRMKTYEGNKIDPKKKDLQRWRELYAKELNKENIQVIATSRASRGVGIKSDKLIVEHMRKKYAQDYSLPKSKRKGYQQPKIDDYIEKNIRNDTKNSNDSNYRQDYNRVTAKMKNTNATYRTAYSLIGKIMEDSSDPSIKEQGKKITDYAKNMPVPKTRLELARIKNKEQER